MIVADVDQMFPATVRGGVYAIGNFDGVHRGHQVLLQKVIDLGNDLGTKTGVIFFEPHPSVFFAPNVPHFQLTTRIDKLSLLEAAGIDIAVILTFNAELAGLTAERFIEEKLVEGLRAKHIVVGYDFHFGKKRGGSPQTLRDAGQVHGFGVTVVAPQASGDMVFSSSQIRKNLMAGHVAAAASLLGHWWSVSGTVKSGAQRGRGLGFPTANIDLAEGVELAHGIYAVRVLARGGTHSGAAYFGSRPTFDDGKPVLEVYLLEFDGDLYGEEITIQFIEFIRTDMAFEDGAALGEQIERDVASARSALANAPEIPKF